MICIGSVYEHDAVDRWLNIRVSNLEELEKALQDNLSDTKFVFWLGVSNITGEIFPVKDIGYLCHKYNAFYICDATALLGHTPIESNIDDWCDFLVLDGHKAGTELGIGAMWVSNRLDNWLNGLKLHGTPNLAGALAMTQAVEDVVSAIEDSFQHWRRLRNSLEIDLTIEEIDYSLVKWDDCPAILAIHLPGFNADALQQFLASQQVYISIGGSACAEKHDYRVLNACGLSNDEAGEVIRVSFGEDSSVEDIEALVEGIVEFKNLFI